MKFAYLVQIILIFISCVKSQIDHSERIDCAPESENADVLCSQRGCIYEPVLEEQGVPWCYYPQDYGYSMEGEPVETSNGYSVRLKRNDAIGSMFGSDEIYVNLDVEFQTNDRIRLKFTSDDADRWTVPISIPSSETKPENPQYEVLFFDNQIFSLKIIRKSTETVIFDTSLPGFVFSDQYLQITTKIPSKNVYGFGENEQHSYRHDLNWQTWTLFGRDQPPSFKDNMYGVHPMYTVLEEDGNAYSVLHLNSNAQELSTTPAPGLVYRTIGGILDIYIFLGPTPENTVEQYTEAIGRYPIPPYWSLGFHLCKYGYNTLENMQAAVDRTAQYGIPHDAQWGDIDIMERSLDFTISQDRFGGLPDYIKELKQRGIKFVTILDPCISTGESKYRPYVLGNQMNVWVKTSDGENALGLVWPNDPIYFGDFTNPATKHWWSILIQEFYDLLEYDGLWIDMNEPANFVNGQLHEGCKNNTLNFPPYKTHAVGDQLADKTLCPDHQHYLSSHYNVHSMYGWSQSEATLNGVQAATGKRGLVLSRSTFVGSGNWVAHWLGDNFSNWDNLKYSIIGMLQFNLFGMPHVGADICGFIGDSEAELCARWHQLGAFYPFSRNHNAIDNIDQDPGVWGDEVANIAKEALQFRYILLPYLYTLFYRHKTQGGTVARALWHEFPQDQNTWGVDTQFLWGNGLMISPVVAQGETSRTIYFPDERWYDISYELASGTITEVTTRKDTIAVSAPLNVIPLHQRGGVIIPIQRPSVTTETSRLNPFELVMGLDDNEAASGELFYDDGNSIGTLESQEYFLSNFSVANGIVRQDIANNGYADMDNLIIATVDIYGIKSDVVSSVKINDAEHADWTFENGRLIINNTNLKWTDPNWVVTYDTV